MNTDHPQRWDLTPLKQHVSKYFNSLVIHLFNCRRFSLFHFFLPNGILPLISSCLQSLVKNKDCWVTLLCRKSSSTSSPQLHPFSLSSPHACNLLLETRIDGIFFPFFFLIRKLLFSLIPPISTGVIQRQIASSKYPVCILSSKEHHPIPSIPLKFPKLSPSNPTNAPQTS